MRILTEQERRFLTVEAQSLAYNCLQASCVPNAMMEKVLLEAVLLGSVHQSPVSGEVFKYLVLRQSEVYFSSAGVSSDFHRQYLLGCLH